MIKTVLFCSILAIVVFSIQLALSIKANKKVIKYIPLYIIIAIYVVALIMGLVEILDGSGGVAIWIIFAFVISIVNTVALFADIVAWIVYKHIKRSK